MDVRPDDAIQAYLKTGEHDPMFFAWPGNGVLDKSRIGTAIFETHSSPRYCGGPKTSKDWPFPMAWISISFHGRSSAQW
jgi:hypothetical protein